MDTAEIDSRKVRRVVWALAALACGASVLMTWPLALKSTDHVLAAAYYWDAYTNTMIMAGHVDALLGRAPLTLYDNYFFAPLPHSIVFNENLFGLSLLFAPFYLLSTNPLWAYNMTLLASLALSAFFTSLLVRRLSGSAWAGAIAGLTFAFCPYVFFELGRLQLVATQWIPACFLLLHRAVESARTRDLFGLGVCYLLQIGTCLYYAMFLVPLLGLTCVVLLVRQRPLTRWYAKLGAAGFGVGLVALAMVYPYFAARGSFDLERSLAFAGSYDGELGFFGNVHPTNHTLTALHHDSPMRGAHEQIAFPGLTVLLLALSAVVIATLEALRRPDARMLLMAGARWAGVVAVAALGTALSHSMLTGALVFAGAAWAQRLWRGPQLFSGVYGLYVAVALLAVAMFVGLTPFAFDGERVRGLYYYFHTYFPGWSGIRKVSRQAVMTTFALVVVASYGSRWLLSRLQSSRSRTWATASVLVFAAWELRCFPHAVQPVWAGASLPQAYAFMATLPAQDLVAALPQSAGARVFRGDAGLAYHNYLMTYHRHRSVNGQSSWQPPATELADRALRALPDPGAQRILQSLGVAHLLVHGADLEPNRRDLLERLNADPDRYERVFADGLDAVFTFKPVSAASLELLETPPLPRAARVIPSAAVRATANQRPERAARAVDAEPRSAWSSDRVQTPGDYLELRLDKPRTIVAIEIENDWNLVQVPFSFELSVSDGANWRRVFSQPELRVYKDLVYEPKDFVVRVVLSEPVTTDRLRLTVQQAAPVPLTIHELRLYTNEPQ